MGSLRRMKIAIFGFGLIPFRILSNKKKNIFQLSSELSKQQSN